MNIDQNTIQVKTINVLTLFLALLLSMASGLGGFAAKTYERDHPSMAAQGMGQDIVDLFLVVPVLIISLILMNRKNRTAAFIFGGTVFYVLYSFVIYCFGVHFNGLFLVYTSILGLSLYIFIFYLMMMGGQSIRTWFEEDLHRKPVAIYFIMVALVFYMLWLKDILPAVWNDTVPSSVEGYDLLVNPVHVLDMAIALPGLLLTAYLLLVGNKWGIILAPILLVFTIILAIALAGMVFMLKMKNISDDLSVAGIFMVLAVISAVFFVFLIKKLRKSSAPAIDGRK